jgi:hypothetical protein
MTDLVYLRWIFKDYVQTSEVDSSKSKIVGFVTRVTRRVPLVKQALLTLPEHLSSPPVFSGVVMLNL